MWSCKVSEETARGMMGYVFSSQAIGLCKINIIFGRSLKNIIENWTCKNSLLSVHGDLR